MDLNTRAFKGPDTKPAVTGWPVSSGVVAGPVNANQPAVVQDNTQAQQKPAKIHVVTGFTFSVDAATTAKVNLRLVEDLAGVAINHEDINIPVGFVGQILVNYPKPIECQPGVTVALITDVSAGAGIKTTGVLRGYSTRV